MSLRRTLAITRRILRQFRRDHRTVALLFVAPIVILSLLSYLLRSQSTPAAKVELINQDTGALGAQVIDATRHQRDINPAFDGWTVGTDEAAAQGRLQRGELDAYVVLPPTLSTNVLQGSFTDEEYVEGSKPYVRTVVERNIQLALVAVGVGRLGGAIPSHRPVQTFLHGGPKLDQVDTLGAAFIGLILFFLVFVITSVAFLRERSQGTLERLMASPLRRPEIVVGYMAGFGILALVQGVIVLLFTLLVIKVHNEGNVGLIFMLEALMAIGAVNLGIFLSMFARSEFQAVQFIPLVIVPQVVLSGVLVPVEAEPGFLQWVSHVLPLTYAVEGLRDVLLRGRGLDSGTLQLDIAVLFGFAAVMVAAAALTLRRRVA